MFTVMAVKITDWRNVTSYVVIKLTDVSEERVIPIFMVYTRVDTLTMTAHFSETSISCYRTTRYHIPTENSLDLILGL